MALTSTTSLDLVGQTATISFYEGASLVDQITYSSNSFTYQAISSYNLSKSDMILYYTFLNAFLTLVYINFPVVGRSSNLIFPLCEFDITISTSGVTHLYYTQSSSGTQVIQINYLPSVVQGSFSTRASPVTISNQEFIMGVGMQQQYFNQVSLN